MTMAEALAVGLSGNLFLLGVACLVIVLLHSVSQWSLKKKGLTHKQLKGQWDDLVKIAKNIEERVTKPEPDWHSPEQVYDFIEEVSQEDSSEIMKAITRERGRAGKSKEELIASCEEINEKLRSKISGRNTKALGWEEIQKWSRLPARLLAYLLALLRKTKQIIIELVQQTHDFLIEFTSVASCSRNTLEPLLKDV